MTRIMPPALAAMSLAGCFYGDEFDWASRTDIVEAAARCGLQDFEPTRAGSAWAAYVRPPVPGGQAKEDCIYNDLSRRGLLATR